MARSTPFKIGKIITKKCLSQFIKSESMDSKCVMDKNLTQEGKTLKIVIIYEINWSQFIALN